MSDYLDDAKEWFYEYDQEVVFVGGPKHGLFLRINSGTIYHCMANRAYRIPAMPDERTMYDASINSTATAQDMVILEYTFERTHDGAFYAMFKGRIG